MVGDEPFDAMTLLCFDAPTAVFSASTVIRDVDGDSVVTVNRAEDGTVQFSVDGPARVVGVEFPVGSP